MNIIAVIGCLGGAGATTVTAQLSAAFTLQNRQTLAFDFSPENRLRLHFGMALNDRTGWALNLAEGQEWNAAAFRSSDSRSFVPFGQLDSDAQLERLISWLRDQPDWFAFQLDLLQVPDDTFIVVNCPRTPSVLRNQVLSVADMVIMVTAADSMSYIESSRLVALANEYRISHLLTVLNGFDPSRQLDRDIALLLRTQQGERFSPVIVHRDEALREAAACKQSVFDFAPSSQSAYDFSALATWVVARIGQIQEAHYEAASQ